MQSADSPSGSFHPRAANIPKPKELPLRLELQGDPVAGAAEFDILVDLLSVVDQREFVDGQPNETGQLGENRADITISETH